MSTCAAKDLRKKFGNNGILLKYSRVHCSEKKAEKIRRKENENTEQEVQVRYDASLRQGRGRKKEPTRDIGSVSCYANQGVRKAIAAIGYGKDQLP